MASRTPAVQVGWVPAAALRYYLCSDSSGVQVGISRTVEVGCEGPNPDGNLDSGGGDGVNSSRFNINGLTNKAIVVCSSQ